MKRFPLNDFCTPYPVRTRKIAIKNGSRSEKEMVHHIVAPHEILGGLFRKSPDTFFTMMGDLEAIGNYWASWTDAMLDADDMLRTHPLRRVPNFRERCIPVDIHIDGVRFTKGGKSASVASFRSRLATTRLSIDTNIAIFFNPSTKKKFVPAHADFIGTEGAIWAAFHH